MKQINAWLGIALATILTGCASTDHIYTTDGKCLTCINNPLTGKPLNHDGSAPGSTMENRKVASDSNNETDSTTTGSSSSNPEFTEFKTTLTVPHDVDRAFLKVKKEYNYHTDQEIKQEWGDMAEMKMGTFAYAYDSTPSVYYHMRAHRDHDSAMYVIDHMIEKLEAGKSEITITVWVNKNSPISPSDVAQSLASRTQSALNR